MKLTLARLVDAHGNTLPPPNPAAVLLEDGKPTANYDLAEIFSLALTRIQQQRETFKQSTVHGEEER